MDGYKVRLVLGKAKYNLDEGDEKRIKVYLAKGYKSYYKKGKIAVVAQAYSQDGGWASEKLLAEALGLLAASAARAACPTISSRCTERGSPAALRRVQLPSSPSSHELRRRRSSGRACPRGRPAASRRAAG